ncbi:MAG TPA: 1-acyl-sn-glycerol-3-phosphate acyltransferase, partial [Thermomicrobiales bacterium]|nr:1-acyl-sn-glycerol-3-phosphate acyltransferase [Thermomicrobiales bacterium]
MLLTGLAFPVLMVAGFVPGIPRLPQVLIAMAIVGAPLAGVYLFPAALIADIVEHDATQTGLRREGAYYGAQSFVEKMTSALTPLALTSLLLLGDSAAHPLGIRLVGPVAALFVLIGLFCFRSYDLEDEVTTTETGGAIDAANDHAASPARHDASPARTFRPTTWSRLQARFGRRVVLLLARFVFRLRLEFAGLENVPAGEPLIVAGAPHRNWIDAFLIMMALPPSPRLFFLGSAEGMFNAWWKRAVLALFGGVVPVSTKGLLNRDGLETSLAILAADNRLGIFPEGWEHVAGPPHEVEPVKRGVAFLSQRSGRRVLPVALAGSKSLWRGKTLRLRIGPPLDALAPDTDRAAAQAYADRLGATLTALLPPLPPEPPVAERRWPWLTQMLD